ncbi:MAG TPA: hypothetical protein VGV57_07740 [Thermoleophilaceae bacterium]|nr:hypothetical protein [Thermoleophilaceae bacterium]
MNQRLERLLLGDWGPIVRDPIDLVRLNFLLGAGVFAVTGDVTTALRLALSFALVVVARFLDLPRPFDLGLNLGIAISVWGGPLGLFHEIGWYDEFLHAFFSFFSAPLFYILGVRLNVLPDLDDDVPQRHRYVGILIVSSSLGFSFGALFEIWEWVANNWFGANNMIGYGDTIADLAEDALASLAGGAMLLGWAEYGWGTSRRVPGLGREASRSSASAAAS